MKEEPSSYRFRSAIVGNTNSRVQFKLGDFHGSSWLMFCLIIRTEDFMVYVEYWVELEMEINVVFLLTD